MHENNYSSNCASNETKRIFLIFYHHLPLGEFMRVLATFSKIDIFAKFKLNILSWSLHNSFLKMIQFNDANENI